MAAHVDWACVDYEMVWAEPQGLADLEARCGVPFDANTAQRPVTNRFTWENADDVEREEISWLVKGVLPLWGLVMLYGPSGSYKSFFSLWLASQVAKGQDVLGGRSMGSGVAYVAAEGAGGMRARVQALRRREGGWGGRIGLISIAPNLCSDNDVEQLRVALAGMKDAMAAAGNVLRLVIIDTMAASTPGAEENSSQSMGAVLARLQTLAAALKVCVLIVHHVGKNAELGPRGWSGMIANADGAIELQRKNDDGTVVGTLVKVKDGEAGRKFAFGLKQVELGVDPDGDPVTSCIVDWRDLPAAAVPAHKPSRRDADAQEVLHAFDTLVRVNPVSIPATFTSQPKIGVLLEDLRQHLFDTGFRGETKPELRQDKDMDKWKAERRMAFKRAMDLLYGEKLRREGQYIWAP